MLPLFLDVTGRLGVVIGGGPVGRRKARTLFDAGARVRLVCREPRHADLPEADWLTDDYRPDHLDGAALAFACATPEVNRLVAADAHARGIWVNAADDPAAGDLLMPAVLRRGGLVVAVGTGGAAPALARRIRDRLAEQFDDAFATWVGLLAELRPVVLATIPDPARRREAFERLSDWEWLERLRSEGAERVRAAMRGLIDPPGAV